MKKVLAAIRRNGVEVATVFDQVFSNTYYKYLNRLGRYRAILSQNHNDNHKNSMASQTVLMELGQGDRVQVGSGHTCHVSRVTSDAAGVPLHLHGAARQARQPPDPIHGRPAEAPHQPPRQLRPDREAQEEGHHVARVIMPQRHHFIAFHVLL